MKCSEMKVLISAYLDGELDSRSSLQLEKHLETCAACKNQLAVLEAMSAKLREVQHVHQHHAPRDPFMARRLPQRNFFYGMASGVAASFIAVFCASVFFSASKTSDDLVELHLRSLQANHLIDVPSSDHHVVKPWFTGRLDFAFDPEDFTAEGFPLLGGRQEMFSGKPAAALAYAHGAHRINLIVQLKQDAGARSCRSERGFNLICWSKADLNYSLVSDVNPVELERLRKLISHEN